MRKIPLLSALVLMFLHITVSSSVVAQEPRIGFSGYPVPRFVNLKNDETWGRVGPSFDYPVRYVFNRKDLPVRVVAETRDNVWRQVEDPEGVKTWIHRTQLVSSNRAMVQTVSGAIIRKAPSPKAEGRAKLENGVIVRLEECNGTWCRVRTDKFRGWVPKSTLWGVS